MTITGKAVLVTGANRGIGQTLVDKALGRGAGRVYAGTRQPLADRDERVTPLLLDVTDAAQIQRAVETVESLDVLINNAGVALYDDLSDRDVLVTSQNVTPAFVVNQTPKQAVAAITDAGGRWSGEIDGSTDELGGEFTYCDHDVHSSTQKITELIPGQTVTWHVVDADLTFTEDHHEGAGTDITFDVAAKGDRTEVRSTHVGPVPGFACYETCSNAWGSSIKNSLRNLTATGGGAPNPKEGSGPTVA
jgi:hypothetical protein